MRRRRIMAVLTAMLLTASAGVAAQDSASGTGLDRQRVEVPEAGIVVAFPDDWSVVVQMVRDQVGPVAVFKTAIVVQRLPKTRSGKILRGTMKKIADKTEWKMPATIDDPVILDEITERLQAIGYA